MGHCSRSTRPDIGIADGRVAEIGRISSSRAARVLDADGLIVAPGFVDLHTHYDGQLQWDPWCSISGWHGVTSVALGNCGFGFAPVRPDERERSMLTMSRTEAIPMETMREGMLWDWETFPEWMDTLDRIPKGVNCLSYMPLAPLMTYVMGLENAKSRSSTPDELAEMQRLMREALSVGACGWSAQRMGTDGLQNDYDGTPDGDRYDVGRRCVRVRRRPRRKASGLHPDHAGDRRWSGGFQGRRTARRTQRLPDPLQRPSSRSKAYRNSIAA